MSIAVSSSLQSQNLRTQLDDIVKIDISKPIANIPKFKDLQGKFVVVDLWATWCEPCLKNMTHINQLQDKFQNSNIAFVALTDENASSVMKTLKRVKINSIVLTDQRKINQFWSGGLKKLILPTTILLDSNSKVKWIGSPSQLSEEVITKLMNETLEPYNFFSQQKH